MYTKQVVDQMKQQIATIRREREAIRPYSSELKQRVLGYAMQELVETGSLHEIEAKLGLEENQLAVWFKQLLPDPG